MISHAVQAVDIIIPTYNNAEMLRNCVQSMVNAYFACPVNIIIVNNGETPVGNDSGIPIVKIVNTGKNLGWTGGLREGLKYSASKYVLFANDDIFIPRGSARYLQYMKHEMELEPKLGAVGPASNVVMGMQNMLNNIPAMLFPTSYLIGFCMLVRREALDAAGGVQDVEHGGDDLDLSIRLRKAGYRLAIQNNAFVFHYGFKTGERVYGTSDKEGGWNSRQMTELTNMELIRKHGFLEYWSTIKNEIFHESVRNQPRSDAPAVDAEGNVVRGFLNGEKIIYELGCGGTKTVAHAIGIDIVPRGVTSPHINQISVADIVADVSQSIPVEDNSADAIISRHIIEHCVDAVKAMKLWANKLKQGGKLIISCPNENLVEGVPLNPEHKHAFTPDSMKALAETAGFVETGCNTTYNGVSFTLCLEKR